MMKHFREWQNSPNTPRLFFESTGLDLAGLAELQQLKSLLLDVGCGYGQFTKMLADTGNEVIAIDMSTSSIELAYRNIGGNPNVHLVQCDLTKLPFNRETFDFVFSIGVLHHVPDAECAFASLVPYLKRRGKIAIWVYPPEMKRIDNKIRKITTKLPKILVFCLCMPMPFVNAFYRWIRKIPPGAYRYGYWPQVLGVFDSWTPKYASVHEPAEVVNWFKKSNLVEIEVLNRRTAVRGIKL
jgi:SAM-dependent methyltransferase